MRTPRYPTARAITTGLIGLDEEAGKHARRGAECLTAGRNIALSDWGDPWSSAEI